VLESDHQPLKWILTNTKLTGKLARWALMLSEFDFEVVHRPGIDNNMDCLSRFPQETTVDTAGVRQEGEREGQCMWSAAACLAWLPLQGGAVLSGLSAEAGVGPGCGAGRNKTGAGPAAAAGEHIAATAASVSAAKGCSRRAAGSGGALREDSDQWRRVLSTDVDRWQRVAGPG
jgi:hypothetical protein